MLFINIFIIFLTVYKEDDSERERERSGLQQCTKKDAADFFAITVFLLCRKEVRLRAPTRYKKKLPL
jgi:hypothetical protein